MSHQFPIRDIQFHEEGIREAASHNLSAEEAIAVSYHSTALAYLQYGFFKGFDGPGAEREVNGAVAAVPIEDYLTPAKDNHGMTYFQFTPKETPTNEPIG